MMTLSATSASSKERADKDYSNSRVERDEGTNKRLASLEHDLPGCLFKKGEPALMAEDEGFTSTCNPYARFSGAPETSGKRSINTAMTKLVQKVRASIKGQGPD